jgi:hypothetical protein
MKQIAPFIFFLFLFSCDKKETVEDAPIAEPSHPFWSTFEPWKVTYGTFAMPFTPDFDPIPLDLGLVDLKEASGIAASRKNPGKIWAHNDSGFPNHLYLIDTTTAEILATFVITGASNIDWEDMEVVADPVTGVPFVYIANTGDNRQRRNDYDVYRFEEPQYDPADFGKEVHLPQGSVTRHRFRFPDGSHDTESMFVDPANLDVYLITKRDASSTIYVLPHPYIAGTAFNKTYKVGELGFKEASAASVSFDGRQVMIKTRQDIFYWERTTANEPYHQLLAQTPVKAPYVGEPQGEAICFDAANNYFTLSEALNLTTPPTLFRYNAK